MAAMLSWVSAARRHGSRSVPSRDTKAVTDTMRWVGSRFTGADAVDVEHTVIASSGDLAYTVGFERSHVSVDGGPPRDMVIRVTHIYRRIDGDWKLIHRHGDFPPPDQRTTST